MSLSLNRVLKQGRWKVGRKLNVTLFSICVADALAPHSYTGCPYIRELARQVVFPTKTVAASPLMVGKCGGTRGIYRIYL